jgi:ABC-type sugar transport system ATPase subunit
MHDVTKTFPGVRALNRATLEVLPGEIHALVGENGAGKSTLMHLVAGVYQPDEGTIELDGMSLVGLDERGAQDAGVAMVYQERSLSSTLSIAENVFAARQPTNRFGVIDRSGLLRQTKDLLAQLEMDLDPDELVENLSPAQQQMVEIAKALSVRLRLLILDEPTSALTINEGRRLFRVLRLLASHGVAIVYVTHRLAEVFELASRVTVLKDGAVMGVRSIDSVTTSQLIELMVGRELSFEPEERRAPADAPVVLAVDALRSSGVIDASFELKAGEIVCLAGLVGAGRTELCETIFGVRPAVGGRMAVRGKPFIPRHPYEAMTAGIGMVPEDRKAAGLFLQMSVTNNVIAADLDSVTTRGLVSDRAADRRAAGFVSSLRIATPDLHREVVNLSGGTQQKVLLAKWLARRPSVLIVDEPTRGVDVGTKADIYQLLRELAASGIGLLVVSSDLPEVLALAHRILVMSEGRIVGELDGGVADELSILKLAAPKATSDERGVA